MMFKQFMTLFEENVHLTSLDPSAKLSRLIRYTKGDARRAIEGCAVLGGSGYTEALKILKTRFGDSTLITQRLMDNLKTGKPVRSNKDLQQFADDLSNCLLTLRTLGQLKEVECQYFILSILGRLQNFLQIRWRKYVSEYRASYSSYPVFQKFVDFIKKAAAEVNDPIYGNLSFRGGQDKGKKTVSTHSVSTGQSGNTGTGNTGTTVIYSRTNGNDQNRHKEARGGSGGSRGSRQSDSSHSHNGDKTKSRYPCVLCKVYHKMFYCDEFKRMTVPERIALVKKHDLCENCLYPNHKTPACLRPNRCTVQGCKKKHTKFIHLDEDEGTKEESVNVVKVEKDEDVKTESTYAGTKVNCGVTVPTVSVIVNGKIPAHALLDSGSTTTFCTERLVNTLGVKGVEVGYRLNTISTKGEHKRGTVVTINLTSKDNSSNLVLRDVHVIPEIPVDVPKVDLHKFPHLENVTASSCSLKGVDLLIGQDHSEALLPLEVKSGKRGEPFAVRTMLGWSINGPVGSGRKVSKRVVSQFMCATELVDDLGKLWEVETENFGDQVSPSKDDEKVVDLWEREVKFVEGHYVLPVPWKPGVSFPNNYIVAANRLTSLLRNLDKKELMPRYREEIDKLLVQGYAERAPVLPPGGQEDHKVWYLPHHAVITPKKPGKVRVVFDCAAKYKGESLNNKAFQGPDLNNKLVNVLLRFREKPIALMADIEAMYNQVRIPHKDRDALRFLWVDEQGKVEEFRMTSHLFGGIWCAASSTFALRRVVQDLTVDEEIVSTVNNSFYVDDCLDSVDTVDQAEKIVFGTQRVLKQKGFNLTKVISNSKSLLDKVPEEHRAKEVKVFSGSSQSKALGVHWDVSKDDFYYKVDMDIEGKVTKRTMLSIVASMYDPLGLMSPIMMTGKLLLQEVVKLKLDWDEVVTSSEITGKWYHWLRTLAEHVGRFRFSRCVTGGIISEYQVELHHFSDASSYAYGACTYIRCISAQGKVYVALMCSKGRIAPMKQMTIPRLELMAAVLSAKADVALRSELRLQVKQSYFWTDSEIVLAYLNNHTARYQVFVGNRVSQITKQTDVKQWFHVPGIDNPADLITRVQDPITFDMGKWTKGPQFLWKKGDVKLPKRGEYDISEDPEVKQVSTFKVDKVDHPIDDMVERYSSWRRLKKCMAYCIRPLHIKTGKLSHVTKLTLSVQEIQDAEILLIKHVQRIFYPDEMDVLQKKGKLAASSSIRDLDPILDANGLLRVGGRLKHADLSVGSVNPIIIPHASTIAILIAREVHEVAHLGVEWTLAMVRRKYWITKGRIVVKQVKKGCVTCKKLYGDTCVQKMADLPYDRVEAGNVPFTNVGCDCFGPFLCKVGRAEIKRYGLLITCLSIRAVHIEMLYDMSTDAFLNGFRRFVARRGSPKKVWCDNGTNFIGARSEVDKGKSSLDYKKIAAQGQMDEIEWKFNPPGAPHMGGVWERMVGVTKRVMTAVMKKARLSDDILCTLFSEVECIVNGRPLTKLSDDADDLMPLTPNHLLILHQGPAPVPGDFSEADMFRKRWRFVQHLANQFWNRWIKEYLPELQRRKKWQNTVDNVKEGDLVLLMDENLPRRVWPLGVIVEVIMGRDKFVRSVRVRTRASIFVRPITKIVSLEAG